MSDNIPENKWQCMQAIVNQHDKIVLFSDKKLIRNRIIIENIFSLLLQYIGLMFSTLTPQPSPIWFATGTTCAFIFLRGYSILPGVFLGSVIAYYFTTYNIGLTFSSAVIYVLQAAALLWICHRSNCPTLIFYRTKSFLLFMLCSILLTGFVSFALIIACSLFLKATFSIESWFNWWLANLNGIVIFSFAIIAWDIYFPTINQLKKSSVMIYSLLFILTLFFLFTQHSILIGLVIFLIMCFLDSISAAFIVGFVVSVGAHLQAPVFAYPHALMFIQLFLLMITCGAYTLTSVAPSRKFHVHLK